MRILVNKKFSSSTALVIGLPKRRWRQIFSKYETQCSGKLGVSNLECRPYLNEKIPKEHSILIIRKILVVVSV